MNSKQDLFNMVRAIMKDDPQKAASALSAHLNAKSKDLLSKISESEERQSGRNRGKPADDDEDEDYSDGQREEDEERDADQEEDVDSPGDRENDRHKMYRNEY